MSVCLIAHTKIKINQPGERVLDRPRRKVGDLGRGASRFTRRIAKTAVVPELDAGRGVGERAENVRHGATWCRDNWQIQTGALDKKSPTGIFRQQTKRTDK